jgi:hypothetical protein
MQRLLRIRHYDPKQPLKPETQEEHTVAAECAVYCMKHLLARRFGLVRQDGTIDIQRCNEVLLKAQDAGVDVFPSSPNGVDLPTMKAFPR